MHWTDGCYLSVLNKILFYHRTDNTIHTCQGIMTAEDAELAIANGADAIWVSNHGLCDQIQCYYTCNKWVWEDSFSGIQ